MQRIPNEPFVLVDGSSYLFRAYHAMPPLVSQTGQPTGAIFGVVNMLRKLIKEFSPRYIGVIFDSKQKNFRHALYPAYKSNRVSMPEELQMQIKPLFEIIKAMGLPLIVVDGVEADDVIATLAIQAREEGLFTVISTGDKDMAQLVAHDIILVNPMSQEILDEAGVKKKFGVAPHQILDYLALIGDSVDNIPGVPKVGPKTAVKWLELYGSLDEILGHQAEISGKVGENLRAFAPQLPLFLELLRLKMDVPMERAPAELVVTPQDLARLKTLFTELEFKSWLAELPESEETRAVLREARERHYACILTEAEFQSWLRCIQEAPLVAFDTETTSLNYMQARVVGLSLSVAPDRAAYIPFGHTYEGVATQLSEAYVLGALKPWLEDPTRAKVGHNLKYDAEVLANHEISLQGIQHDTMLMSYVLNSTQQHSLDSVAVKRLGVQTITFEMLAGKGQKQLTFDQVPLEQAAPYAAEDADLCLQIYQACLAEFEQTPSLKAVYETIEIPLIPVLVGMERLGALIDKDLLKIQSQALGERLSELEGLAFELAGSEFNLNSPKQLQEILFQRLQLPQLEKTPTGQPSTGENVLQELALTYPLPKLILEYRSLAKLKSTYTDSLPEQIDTNTGRVHTSYHQAITATGRLSSSHPNLQNIPIRTEEGRKIRSAFIAPSGYKLVSADYSQIELRIMAHLSQDAALLDAFRNDADVHTATAAEIFNVAPGAVTPNQRRDAKAINFGLIYGMSAFGLARTINVSRANAERYMQDYFARFPGVKIYMDKTREQANRLGYVETVFGRRLYLSDLKSRVPGKHKAAERAAINAPMQGTAADIIKLAMIQVSRVLKQEAPGVRMIMQVHDELIFEVPDEALEHVVPLIKHHMETAAELSVPLKVDCGVGPNWDEAH